MIILAILCYEVSYTNQCHSSNVITTIPTCVYICKIHLPLCTFLVCLGSLEQRRFTENSFHFSPLWFSMPTAILGPSPLSLARTSDSFSVVKSSLSITFCVNSKIKGARQCHHNKPFTEFVTTEIQTFFKPYQKWCTSRESYKRSVRV